MTYLEVIGFFFLGIGGITSLLSIVLAGLSYKIVHLAFVAANSEFTNHRVFILYLTELSLGRITIEEFKNKLNIE